MTNQEIFNKVREHLLQQNRKAYKGNRCTYRDPDGGKCAVGALIPDENYMPIMEESSVGLLYVDNNLYVAGENMGPGAKALAFALNTIGVPASALSLLSQLQLTHDNFEPENWELQLQRVADQYQLEVPK